MAGGVPGHNALPPQKSRPGYSWVPGKGWVKNTTASGTKGTGVRPGSAPPPSKPFKVPGGVEVQVSGNHIGTVNVAGIRAFLKSKGYDLPSSKDAGLGKALAGALNNFGPGSVPKRFGSADAIRTLLQQKGWHSDQDTGKKTVKSFNTSFGTKTKVGVGPAKGLTSGGNLTPKVQAAGTSYDPSSLTADANAISSTAPLDENLSQLGAHLLSDPQKLADALAGLQYDSQLRDAAHSRDVNVQQTKQNQTDIGSWYDQVMKSQATGATRDAAINKAGLASTQASNAAILASLGGDASAGAGTVANAQQANQGTLAALGTAQDQYNADVAPIMTQERAGQLTTERARGSQRASDLAQQLANLQGERGGSVASHLMDINQYNNTIRDNQLQRLLQIKQANQAQTQQDFQNNLAIQQAKLAALATGAKILAATKGKAAKGSFADTPASVKSQVAATIYNDLAAVKSKTPNLTLAQAQAVVRARLTGAGWNFNNPAVTSYAHSILNNWSQSQSA